MRKSSEGLSAQPEYLTKIRRSAQRQKPVEFCNTIGATADTPTGAAKVAIDPSATLGLATDRMLKAVLLELTAELR